MASFITQVTIHDVYRSPAIGMKNKTTIVASTKHMMNDRVREEIQEGTSSSSLLVEGRMGSETQSSPSPNHHESSHRITAGGNHLLPPHNHGNNNNKDKEKDNGPVRHGSNPMQMLDLLRNV